MSTLSLNRFYSCFLLPALTPTRLSMGLSPIQRALGVFQLCALDHLTMVLSSLFITVLLMPGAVYKWFFCLLWRSYPLLQQIVRFKIGGCKTKGIHTHAVQNTACWSVVLTWSFQYLREGVRPCDCSDSFLHSEVLESLLWLWGPRLWLMVPKSLRAWPHR